MSPARRLDFHHTQGLTGGRAVGYISWGEPRPKRMPLPSLMRSTKLEVRSSKKTNKKKHNRTLYFRKFLYFFKEKEYIWERIKS